MFCDRFLMLAPEVLFTPGSFAEEEADMRFTPPTPPGLPLELAKDGVLSVPARG